MAKNAAAVAKNFRAAATTMQRDQRKAIEASALAAKTALLSVPGAPRRLRNVGNVDKGGTKVGVRYDVKGVGNPTALVRWTGPAHLVNNPTKAHPIHRRVGRAKGKGSGRINRQAALNVAFRGRGAFTGGSLKLPDGGFRKVVDHPGTKGKHFYEKGRVIAERVVPETYRRQIRTQLSKHFTGG